MEEKQMEEQAGRLKRLMAEIAALEGQAEALRRELKAAMGPEEEVQAGIFTLRYKPVTTSRVDLAEMRRVIPGVVQQFTRPVTTRRFTIQ